MALLHENLRGYMVILYSRGCNLFFKVNIMATDAQRKANTKYKEKCKGKFAEMRYRVSVEERDEIKAYCDAHDISVSDFTRELVFRKIRENV